MIRNAKAQDIDAIMEIIKGTIAVMEEENNPQWGTDYPNRSDFLKDIEAGTLFVEEKEGRIRGVICVNQTEPKEYQPIAWGSPAPATVIHRMAVNLEDRRQGVGRALMKFAEETAQEQKTNYLKTDTYGTNKKMNGLFLSCGYIKKGEMQFNGRPGYFNCYEKQLPVMH